MPLALVSNSAATVAWDCDTYPLPIQIIKGDSDSSYRTMQLNIAAQTFQQVWLWDSSSTTAPSAVMNAMAYNVNDGIAYGLFSPSTSGGSYYLCRFSHVANSQDCLCHTGTFFGWSATITSGEPRRLHMQLNSSCPTHSCRTARSCRWDLLSVHRWHHDKETGEYAQHAIPTQPRTNQLAA